MIYYSYEEMRNILNAIIVPQFCDDVLKDNYLEVYCKLMDEDSKNALTDINFEQIDKISLYAFLCELCDFRNIYCNVLEKYNSGLLTVIDNITQNVNLVLDNNGRNEIEMGLIAFEHYLDEQNTKAETKIKRNKKYNYLYTALLASKIETFQSTYILRQYNRLLLKFKLLINYIETEERINYDKKSMAFAKWSILIGIFGLFIGAIGLL